MMSESFINCLENLRFLTQNKPDLNAPFYEIKDFVKFDDKNSVEYPHLVDLALSLLVSFDENLGLNSKENLSLNSNLNENLKENLDLKENLNLNKNLISQENLNEISNLNFTKENLSFAKENLNENLNSQENLSLNLNSQNKSKDFLKELSNLSFNKSLKFSKKSLYQANANSVLAPLLWQGKFYMQSALLNLDGKLLRLNNEFEKNTFFVLSTMKNAEIDYEILDKKLDIYDFSFAFFSENLKKIKNAEVSLIKHLLRHTKQKALIITSAVFAESEQYAEFKAAILPHIECVISISNLPNTNAKFYIFLLNKAYKNDYFISLNAQNLMFSDRGRKPFFMQNERILQTLNEAFLNARLSNESKNEAQIIRHRDFAEFNYNFNTDNFKLFLECKKERKNSNLNFTKLSSIAEIRVSQSLLHRKNSVNHLENKNQILILTPNNFAKFGFSENYELGDVADFARARAYKLESFDLVISTKGKVGEIAIVGDLNKQNVVVPPTCSIIRFKALKKEKIAIAYYMFLKSNHARALLKSSLIGSLMQQISPNTLRKLQVPILSEENIEKLNKKFEDEIKLYEELFLIQNQISNLHERFFDDLS